MAETRGLPEWLAYLERLHPAAIELGLERVAAVRDRLGLAPGFPIITVGGTNGKGSTCALLEAILHAAGYSVGCYTSPHLLEYNERVRIGKQKVTDAELCAAFERIESARTIAPEVSLTYFEFGTLAAMLCFIDRGVDCAILEVGLGGRLDAVNAFDADCAVVCSIGLDHTDYLGDTREAIAFEKAGIFRRGKVAIYGDPDMPDAIAQQAEQAGALLWRQGRAYSCATHPGQWDYIGPAGARHALPYPALRGAFQLNNASAALAALDALYRKLPVGMDAVRRGLAEVTLPGRFQVLPGRPAVILDVAHNPAAAEVLAGTLGQLPPARTLAVIAMLADKDMAGVARALDKHVDVWLAAGLDVPRGASSAQMAQALVAAGVQGEVRQYATPAEACRHASLAASENDRILVIGSFYTVAEVMRVKLARTG